MAPSPRKEKKAKVSATSKTVMENGHIDTSDNTETLIGSQYGMSKLKRKEQDMVSMNGGLDELPVLGLPAQNRPEVDGIISVLMPLTLGLPPYKNQTGGDSCMSKTQQTHFHCLLRKRHRPHNKY